MATLVKFRKEKRGNILAIFPQIKHNKRLYGNAMLTCYAHLGQHSCCDTSYTRECKPATETEYKPLLLELQSIGYILKVCK